MDDSKLREIKAAEKQAADIVEEAKQLYQKLIAEAQESAIASFEEEKNQVKQQSRETLARYRTEGQKEAKEILTGLETQVSNIQAQAEKKRTKAIEYVISELKR